MNTRLRILLLALALGAPACTKACDSPDAPAAAPPEPRDPKGPPSQQELPTTDGAIAVGNLSSQIDALEGLLRKDPNDVSSKQQLVPLLSVRSRYLARIADAERGAALAEDLVRAAPGKASSYLARSGARASMHLFQAALADLAEAEKHGATPAELRAERAGILQGQGDLDGALALRHAGREEHADLVSMGLEAAVLGEMGKTEEASDLFRKAILEYKNVSPFPVAWLFFQHGLVWERAGDTARARAYFAAARARLPAYAHATSHLAPLAPPQRAIEMLTPIAASSDDPEIELVLAGRLRAQGDKAGAESHIAHVRARYEELVKAHPEAYAEHYGFFLMDESKDFARALELARTNLAVRKTEKSYQLALLAALGAGKRDEACALGRGVEALPRASEMLRGIAADACKK